MRHNLVENREITDPWRERHYRYDEAGHLREARQGVLPAEQFYCDPAGNITESEGPVRHNRVTAYRNVRYRYDDFGRVSERVLATETQTLEYDSFHRLVRVRCRSPQKQTADRDIRYRYDALGRRTEKRVESWVPGALRDLDPPAVSGTRFVWEGLRLLSEEQDGRTRLYVYEDQNSHTPLVRVEGKGKETRYRWYHCQPNGMPERLTDEKGDIRWEGVTRAWGGTAREAGDEEENLRFQGQYLDRETGLHYNLFRYYDPESGRFTQQDPIGLAGGLNTYAYAPNPLTWIDPLGLRKCTSGFSSADDAARAALNKYNPMSIFKNREYGGIIYRAKDGSYGYTRGRLGTGRTAPTFKDSAGGLPKGSTPVGQYHTHGDYSDAGFNRTNKAGDYHDSDIFSGADIRIHNNANNTFPGYTDALGTPSGGFWKIFGRVSGPNDATPL